MGKNTRLLTELYYGLSSNEISIFRKAFEIQQLDIVNNEYLEPILRSTYISSQVENMVNNNICLSYDTCVESGGTMDFLKDGAQACVICAPDKFYNPDTKQC